MTQLRKSWTAALTLLLAILAAVAFMPVIRADATSLRSALKYNGGNLISFMQQQDEPQLPASSINAPPDEPEYKPGVERSRVANLNTSASLPKVVVVGAPGLSTWNNDVQTKLLSTGLFSQVDIVNAAATTPTLAQLQQYDAALVYSDTSFQDRVTLGNNLADFVDAGGGVVVATFALYNSSFGLGMGGRLSSGGYMPFAPANQNQGTELFMVKDDLAHPILSGVNSFSGGPNSYHHSPLSLTSGAHLVAHWTNGQPLVATKQITSGRVVGLNLYPPSSTVRSDFWRANTDGAALMGNSLLYAANTTCSGNVLVIWDVNNGNTQSLATALTNAGMNVTLSQTSETGYNGTNPSPANFEAVIHLNGETYDADMPLAGQQALVNYVQNGGAYLQGEWDSYEFVNGRMQLMRDLILFDRVSGVAGSLTLTEVPAQSGHPVLANVPASFSFNGGANVGPVHTFAVNPATVLMTDQSGNDAVAVRQFGSGRIVGFHHAGNYAGLPVLTNPNIQQLYIDGIRWARRCNSGNTAPSAQPDSFNTDEDVALNTTIANGVLFNDTDAENNPLTASLVSGPTNSQSFTFNSDGTFNYTPAANYHGPDSFTYKANDGTLDSEVVTVTIEVNSVNDLPTAEAGAAQVIECGGSSTSVSLDAAGSGDVDGDTLTYDWSEGATHLADGATPTINLARGVHNITLTVTDPDNASATDTVLITIQDTLAPTVTAPANVSVNTDAGQCSASIDPGTASASDQCGAATVAGVRDDGQPLNAPYPKGVTTITWTATDDVGLTDTESQTITVTDAEDPVVSPPAAVNVNTDPGSCSALINPGTATATDNCAGTSVAGVRDDGQPLNAAYPKGTTTIAWTATDAVGRTHSGTQTVTVSDNENPAVSVPGNISQSTDPNACSAAIDPGTATAADNCSGATVAGVRDDGQPLNAAYPKGTTTITWTATDAVGNTDAKTQTVTVNDTENPVVSCPANIVQSTDAGSCSAAVNITAATFTDNCSGGSVAGVRSDGQPLTAVYPKGTTTITWTATDAVGNQDSCAQTITINDTEKPVIVAPDITVPTTIAGSCATSPVNYSGLSVTDNCPGVGYTLSIPSGSSFGFGSTPVLVTATDAAGNVQTKTFTVTVQKVATVSSVSVTPSTQQYSDRVTFEARLQPSACANAGTAATSVTFFVGSQNMGTVPLASVSGVLVGSINAPLLEPTPFGTAPTGQMAPGPHTVTAVFGGVNPNFIVGSPTTPLNITPEDARAYYTGACFASTSSAGSSSATVTLSATIKDISALDVADTNPGDIRNARITFINRDTNTVIASNLPVGLVSAGDTTVGTATYNWNVNIGSADSVSYTIGVIVTNYYTRNSSDDNSVVTVSKPLGTNFITGGGYLVLTNSSGLYAGGVGTKNNFGFNVKFNKNGTNLQGSINAIVRNGGRVYQIKGNAMTSLSVTGNKAIYNGKANIQDITDPLNPIPIDGNGTLQVKLTDLGEPGKSDTISITIWNKNGGLWFASNWDGTKTIEQLLGGGNLVVR